MVVLSATKKIEIHCISAIATLRIKKRRDDIVWLLKNIGRWDFSEGETRNLERYLENYLEVMKNGQITHEGMKAIKTQDVLIPESGLYKIYYVRDPITGNKVIDFNREKPYEKYVLGNTEEFFDFQDYDDNYHKTWSEKSSEFHIWFEHVREENPRILRRTTTTATLKIVYDSENGCSLQVVSDDGRFSYHDPDYTHFSLSANIKKLVENWEQDLMAKLVSFPDIEGTNACYSFETDLFFEGQNLLFNWGEDTSDYQIEVSKVQLLPESRMDAEKWLHWLVITRLEDEDAYLTLQYVEEIEDQILDKMPLRKRFSDLQIGGKEHYKLIESNEQREKLNWKIRVAEDLYPNL